MVKKTLGYVEMEWACPSCGARNPGTEETCQSCGAKMPEGVEFELPVQQELDTSTETAARAAVGPDIHCPYCGARNLGNATTCSQCGGDLSEGARREAGEVVGAYETGPVPDVICPHCGTSNPAVATKCSSCGGNLEKESPRKEPAPVSQPKKLSTPLLIGLFLAASLCCFVIGLFVLTRGSSEAVALVQNVEWTYAIELEELGPVAYEDWRDQVSSSAQLGSCVQKVRHTEQEPVPGATEVCGTPYVEDTGTGQGKVVQDCEYLVTDDWCEFTLDEWKSVGEKVATGHDLNPKWPDLNLRSDQRAGRRHEQYRVVLDADGKDYIYHPDDLQGFRQFEVGSRWLVETNALGGLTSVKPAN